MEVLWPASKTLALKFTERIYLGAQQKNSKICEANSKSKLQFK